MAKSKSKSKSKTSETSSPSSFPGIRPVNKLELMNPNTMTIPSSSSLSDYQMINLPAVILSQLLYAGPDGAAIRAKETGAADAQRQLQLARTRTAELHDRLLDLKQTMKAKLKRMKKTKLCKRDAAQLDALYQESLTAAKDEADLGSYAISVLFELRQAVQRRKKAIAYGLNLHQQAQLRRGQLMKLLSEAGRALPLYISSSTKIDQSAPLQLVGAIPVADPDRYVAKVGDFVAAFTGSFTITSGENQPWILGEVAHYDSDKGLYQVDDIDNDGGGEAGTNTPVDRHILSRRKVVPLPQWRADPLNNPDAIFKRNVRVLALYPQTTCFYGAVVYEPPTTAAEPYRLRFEDSTCPGGYADPLEVAQRYVIAYREMD